MAFDTRIVKLNLNEKTSNVLIDVKLKDEHEDLKQMSFKEFLDVLPIISKKMKGMNLRIYVREKSEEMKSRKKTAPKKEKSKEE